MVIRQIRADRINQAIIWTKDGARKWRLMKTCKELNWFSPLESLHSNQILVYSYNDFYFGVDSSKTFSTLEKEALRSKRRAESVAT